MNGPNTPQPDPRDATKTQAQQGVTLDVAVPKRIGQYHIKRPIASGGMGTVYEAVQEKPRRTVALKVMRAGIASRSALRRFEYESQLLARLRHPGIAQVYDAGTHRDGEVTVPYFVMEYVVGAKPLTDYAKEKKLGTRERLKLFSEVCDAVHHGHQKGIIHRDLKPSNILVDSSGQVKIIDFGVARSTDSDMAVTTLQTNVGQLIGTLQYMSPEQCAADPHDIDTRSDVYALGVNLYELLCDRMPYDISNVSIYQATKLIHEQEPVKLSISRKALRGDIESIVLKALEKDRDRRFRSAAELGDDIRHYLRGEPITARPPTVAYQLRIFAKRHKTLLGAVAAVFVVLLGGIVATTSMYAKAERNAVRAMAEAKRARTEAAKSERVAQLVRDMLKGVGPSVALGRDTTLLREILDRTALELDSKLQDQPEVEAALRQTLGITYGELGEYSAASPQLRKSLALNRQVFGEEHTSIAAGLNDLAEVLGQQGNYAKAEPLHRSALAMRRKLLNPKDPVLAESLNNLAGLLQAKGAYAEAGPLYQEALTIWRDAHGDEHPDVARCLNNLGMLHHAQGDYVKGEPLLREALAIWRRLLGEEHPDICSCLNNLAGTLHAQGDYARAEVLYREALAMSRMLFGDEHPQVALTLKNLAQVLQANGDMGGAETFYREALVMQRKLLGDEHPNVATTLNNLAFLLQAKGDMLRAGDLYREALTLFRKQLGYEHSKTLLTLGNLGDTYSQTGKLAEAYPLLSEAAERTDAVLGAHPATAINYRKFGVCLMKMKRFPEAQRALLRAHEVFVATVGSQHVRTLRTAGNLATLYDTWHAAESGPDVRRDYAAKAAEWRKKLPKENDE